jgi:hypothetical protein
MGNRTAPHAQARTVTTLQPAGPTTDFMPTVLMPAPTLCLDELRRIHDTVQLQQRIREETSQATGHRPRPPTLSGIVGCGISSHSRLVRQQLIEFAVRCRDHISVVPVGGVPGTAN